MAKKTTKTTPVKKAISKNGRTSVDAREKQMPKFRDAKSAATSYELFFEEIQKPERYKDTILGLRHKYKLHEFVEWALKRLIDSKFENRFSIQPEKYGISNGRIDMALYHTPRTIIHFELIATCSNGHVFRDTTSLLASRADEKLAILIDEDLDPEVTRNFLKAIPDGQIKFVFLREALLDMTPGRFLGIVEDLIGSAEFKNGSTDPKRFFCSLQGREIEIYEKLQLEFHNAPVNETITIQLQQHESMFKSERLTSTKILQPDGVIHIPIRYLRHAPGESYYLAAYLSNGERWRTRVYIRKAIDPPVVFVVPGQYPPLSEVKFSVQNFPPKAELLAMIVQQCAQGCNQGQEVVTDTNGQASGVFTVPHFIGTEPIQAGEHALIISTRNSPFAAQAETSVNILAAEVSQQLWHPIGSMDQNHFASVVLSGVGFRKDEIEIEYELVNLSSEVLTFMNVSVHVKNMKTPIPQFFQGEIKIPTSFYPGESIYPGEFIRRKERFIRIEMSGEVVFEPSAHLQVSWPFFMGDLSKKPGPAFSLSVGYVLLDPEIEALRG